MPKKATIEQRIEWHLEHVKNCACRPIPDKLIEEMKKRKLPVLRRLSLIRSTQI